MEIYVFSKQNSYDCKHLETRIEKKCYFKDQMLSDGDKLDDGALKGSCIGSCTCDYKRFICVHTNCPENFGPRPEPGCTRQYSNDECCATGTICGNFYDLLS